MCKPRRRGQISKRYIPPSHHLPVITHPGFILFFSFLFFQNFVDCSDQLFSFLDLDGRQALWSGSSWPPKYAGEFASFISCHFASAPRRNKAPQKWIRKTWQVKEDEWSCIVIRFVMCLAQDEGPSNLLPRSKMKHYCLFYF